MYLQDWESSDQGAKAAEQRWEGIVWGREKRMDVGVGVGIER